MKSLPSFIFVQHTNQNIFDIITWLQLAPYYIISHLTYPVSVGLGSVMTVYHDSHPLIHNPKLIQLKSTPRTANSRVNLPAGDIELPFGVSACGLAECLFVSPAWGQSLAFTFPSLFSAFVFMCSPTSARTITTTFTSTRLS